jgi:hypothetical protein
VNLGLAILLRAELGFLRQLILQNSNLGTMTTVGLVIYFCGWE